VPDRTPIARVAFPALRPRKLPVLPLLPPMASDEISPK